MYRTRWTRVWWLFFAAVTLTVHGCRSHVSVHEYAPVSSWPDVIAVLPFGDMSAIYGEGVNVRSPVSGKVFVTGSVLPGADELLLDGLNRILSEKHNLDLISMGHTEGTMGELLQNSTGVSDRERAVTIGKRVQATGVMVGYIYRFIQRVGAPYAAESAASVAFEVHGIDVETGRVFWGGDVDETQGALSENLLKIGTFLKRKGRWITAEEMALSGLEDLMKHFKVDR